MTLVITEKTLMDDWCQETINLNTLYRRDVLVKRYGKLEKIRGEVVKILKT